MRGQMSKPAPGRPPPSTASDPQRPCRAHPGPASDPQHPSVLPRGCSRSPETKNRFKLQLFCDCGLSHDAKTQIEALKRIKNGIFQALRSRESSAIAKSCKDAEFFVFAIGSIVATGQILRKRAGYHGGQTKFRNKKGARYADASRKTNFAGIYASLAPYCS